MVQLVDAPRLVKPGGGTYTFPEGLFYLKNVDLTLKLQEYTASGQHGSEVDWLTTSLSAGRIDLPGSLVADDAASLRNLIDSIKKSVQYDGWQRLYFSDDRYLPVTLAGIQESYPDGTDNWCDLVISFLTKPYQCGQDIALTFDVAASPTAISVSNPGSLSCPFEMRIIGQTVSTKKLASPQVTDGKQVLKYSGSIGTSDTLIVDTGAPSAYLNGSLALAGMNDAFLTDLVFLPPGESVWTFTDDSTGGHTGQLVFTFAPRYM